MLNDSSLAAVCEQVLGARPAAVLFRAGHLSQVVGVQLADGRTAVVKIRPHETRIAGCVAVQEHLLAWLIRSAPDVATVPDLAPSPPWTGWDHPGSRLWPDLDDNGRDLNEVSGPAWVDEAARRVRHRMNGCDGPVRIGHGDWESQNIRWAAERPLAVHDWDSVLAQPETAIVGLASAVWPVGESSDGATVGQSADFIAEYQAAAGTCWTERDVGHAWAAGLWVRLFNAKKDAGYGGGSQLDRLAAEIGERLARSVL